MLINRLNVFFFFAAYWLTSVFWTVYWLIICTKKITQFWLAEKGVQFLCNTSTRTNQIRADLTTNLRKNGYGSQQTVTIICKQNNNRKVKKYSKNLNTVKSTSFWLFVCWEPWPFFLKFVVKSALIWLVLGRFFCVFNQSETICNLHSCYKFALVLHSLHSCYRGTALLSQPIRIE